MPVALQEDVPGIAEPSRSNGSKMSSPGQRKSKRNGKPSNQRPITELFTRKRNRSPEQGDCIEKKVKIEDEKDEHSPDTIIEQKEEVCNSPSSETIEVKTEESNNNGSDTIDSANNNNDEEKSPKRIFIEPEKNAMNERCNTCRQYLNNSDLIYYEGHPQNSVEEYVALTNEKLTLESGEEGDVMERPQTNITGYSIYDEEGHLCPIDSGLVESDSRIYMSGYLKSICSDSTDIDEDSIPVRDVGPIIEWYIHGFDGGMKNCIAVSTEFGEYNLLKPNEQYMPLMNSLYEKIWLSKVIVEYLEEFHYLQPTYEDLLEILRESTIPELDNKVMTEEMLHKHAQFVCDQVVSLEVEDDEEPLITLPCMRELIKLMGIKFGRKKIRAKIEYKKVDKKAWTKATTTPLVRNIFESFFTNQLDKASKDLSLRRKRCGVCEACQQPDCGECNACRAMAKFGGHGRTKKACVRRNCPNMAVEHANESDLEDEDEFKPTVDKKEVENNDDLVPVKLSGMGKKHVEWVGEVKTEGTKVYYECANIDDMTINIGDYVMVATAQPNIPSLIVRVVYMWTDTIFPKSGLFHGEVFMRSSDTVLGEVGNVREVFLADRCCNGAPLSSILRKAHVEKRETPQDWFNLGGKEVDEEPLEDDGKTYFYNKYYERLTARFEDLPENPICPNPNRLHRFCASCERKNRREAKDIPKVVDKLNENYQDTNRSQWSLVRWRDHEFKAGSAVFLKPGSFNLKSSLSNEGSKVPKLEKVDEEMYPEYYRKSDNNTRGSNVDTGEPYCVAHIVAVLARGTGPLVPPQDIFLSVRVLYRPENTPSKFPLNEDCNLVYWSDDIREISFSSVAGPCNLVYEKNIPDRASIREWLERDPTRMYFKEAYDKSSNKIIPVPSHAEEVGRLDKLKSKGKGKGKGKGTSQLTAQESIDASSEETIRPLHTLDVFAGCGGLSAGLHAAGVSTPRWAVELTEPAAHAYALNNRNCAVFREDCNALLAAAMAGEDRSATGLPLPRRGEVELMCGGPPCQGFSGMNRFNEREYSNFKNSLVASYLSYCDYYRPKYFILENVRNFVAFKRGMVLKLTLRALLAMGYQCAFGVLQAGQYGVPQTRRRLLVIAAAPGRPLPKHPAPTHVFSRRACSLSVTVDGKRYEAPHETIAAPRRTITVRDAMADLPRIPNGAACLELDYGSLPETHFQRLVRPHDETVKLRDHICKNMAPLIQARIARIPVAPGSDWRDLPNVSVTLSDGTKCKVLQYRYDDRKAGRARNGALRGVCACAAGGTCQPHDKQDNTLIPWCLPHTANRHNNWAGLYGRVAWDGYFSTTVTDPEPMGKQGRVLHPEQSRVVSVRECARSQGFHDTYIFAGSVLDKHRQIGNAVPPPLGAAVGREIVKSIIATKS